mmetsp:Transcript_28106/g.83729  ORF Transcript_28106/g.83729 Transcript_28106/m.83729 type:complete len:208 (-) Transcript_28106:778-1401(-)
MVSCRPRWTRPRCWAKRAQSSMGDQGSDCSSSMSQSSSFSACVPASWRASTCCSDAGFTCRSSCSGTVARSMTQRMEEKGSWTWASGMSMPMICTSRGTSSRGKTTPGQSQRQVRSSRISVCRIFVWPGVALTLTNLPPISEFTSEDLPTLGCPTRPSMMRSLRIPASASSKSPLTSFFGNSCFAAQAAWAAWQASMRAARPTFSPS